MITDAELATLADKSSRVPEYVKLYREHDYLTAYAKHTDLRVAKDPHEAIGGLWEEYGDIQRDFLIARGLKPHHWFLDFGCGTGRLARKLVPYLDPGNYFGEDISFKALRYAEWLAAQEGWVGSKPTFAQPNLIFGLMVDYIWAFSVVIHLPASEVERLFEMASCRLLENGQFLFSYVPTKRPTRTGLKQFKHPREFFVRTAKRHGLVISDVPEWTGRQKVLCASRD